MEKYGATMYTEEQLDEARQLENVVLLGGREPDDMVYRLTSLDGEGQLRRRDDEDSEDDDEDEEDSDDEGDYGKKKRGRDDDEEEGATCTRSTLVAGLVPSSVVTAYTATETMTSRIDCGSCAVVWKTATLMPLVPVLPRETVTGVGAWRETILLCDAPTTTTTRD